MPQPGYPAYPTSPPQQPTYPPQQPAYPPQHPTYPPQQPTYPPPQPTPTPTVHLVYGRTDVSMEEWRALQSQYHYQNFLTAVHAMNL